MVVKTTLLAAFYTAYFSTVRDSSYDEGSILCKIAFAKPTLRAIQASAHTALLTFELATASPASECLA